MHPPVIPWNLMRSIWNQYISILLLFTIHILSIDTDRTVAVAICYLVWQRLICRKVCGFLGTFPPLLNLLSQACESCLSVCSTLEYVNLVCCFFALSQFCVCLSLTKICWNGEIFLQFCFIYKCMDRQNLCNFSCFVVWNIYRVQQNWWKQLSFVHFLPL